MDITRRGFVRNAFGTAALVRLAGESPAWTQEGSLPVKDDFYLGLVRENDALLPVTADRIKDRTQRFEPRPLAGAIGVVSAAYCAIESVHYRSAQLPVVLAQAAERLLSAQHSDGTIDQGNYNSPPDTGFVIQGVCTALTVLRAMKRTELDQVDSQLEMFLRKAGDALSVGGVHTPNHRWVVSSALAQINALMPSPKYVARIDDWLGEGIDCDIDGQFSERSTGIYSRVIDGALITIARKLQRPELLDPVRKNLVMNLYYMHPDGELETVASRRQDELARGWIANYYLPYRYMAIRDKNRQFAGATRFIEQLGLEHSEARVPLIEFLEEPLYRQVLPEPEPLPFSYVRFFSNSALARLRRGDVSATVYGGSDWPLGFASGLASNPTFFNFRKGKAVLESVRMLPDFFSAGLFRSSGMKVEGNQYFLQQQVSVPYYQPLPKQLRNTKGDYALTSAGGRFWSKLNFPERPKSNIQSLNQKITVTQKESSFELAFDVDGHDGVPITVELTFRKGGTFDGTEPDAKSADVHRLRQGIGRYSVGGDTITFGPGQIANEAIPVAKPYDDPYVGAPHPDSYRVYITGMTPFRKVLTIS
jgi:hypothetical protein